MLEQDYLLIAVDESKKFAIRFLHLKNGSKDSIALKKPPNALEPYYHQFLLGSVLLGSRAKDQETVLYKLHFHPSEILMNCEVNPLGGFRSAMFPKDNLDLFQSPSEGVMHASVLKKNNQVYTSTLKVIESDIVLTVREYLSQSIQTQSIFEIFSDYGLWIEKLPETSEKDWEDLVARFKPKGFFEQCVQGTDDPDIMVKRLFPFSIQIMVVTKPRMVCACNLEAFQRALISLPKRDLLEISMGGEGLESECDYCGKVWRVEEEFIASLIS